jgi:DNA-directed RNA polymerase specialized sigma24 family protein
LTDLAAKFETHRPKLLGLAYRLLGSASEAEDAVQDAYLRLHKADHAAIRSLPASSLEDLLRTPPTNTRIS